jgi:hypothetical protein
MDFAGMFERNGAIPIEFNLIDMVITFRQPVCA